MKQIGKITLQNLFPRAVHDLRSAKVSPWILYLSSTGDNLLKRFNSEQVKMIEDFMSLILAKEVFF